MINDANVLANRVGQGNTNLDCLICGVRAATITGDSLGLEYAVGALQREDLATLALRVAWPEFVTRTILSNSIFVNQSGFVIQVARKAGAPTVAGLIILDQGLGLVDYCIETTKLERNRNLLYPIIHRIATRESIKRHPRLR